MYLKDFENVGRVCLDCKSNIVAIANKEQKNWGFSWLVREKKKKPKKWEICEWRRNGSFFRQKPIDKQGESEIQTWIKIWVYDLAATKARLVTGSWSVDSGDKIQGTWSPIMDLLWRRWRLVLQRGFGFLLSGKRRDKEGREELGIYGCSLSWLKKYYFSMLVSFFYHSNTHTKHIFYIFWTLKNVV